MSLPDVTILIGPYTRLSLAVNATVRQGRSALNSAGVTVAPTRLASPAARALALGDAPPEQRLSTFRSSFGTDQPVFLAALNFLGAPTQSIARRELFSDMAALCLGLSAACEVTPRLVLAVESLDQFFVSAGSDAVAGRVKTTPWEALYELSWADLASDILAAMPSVELCVIAPETAICRHDQLAGSLFGPGADAIDSGSWQSAHLSPEGQAAIVQLADTNPSEQVLLELADKLGNGPSTEVLADKYGIDGLTQTLLRQRFEEDLARISDLPGVRML